MGDKEIARIFETIARTLEETKDLSFEAYMSMIAMLLEERCKKEGMPMLEACKNLWVAAVSVNKELGKY